MQAWAVVLQEKYSNTKSISDLENLSGNYSGVPDHNLLESVRRPSVMKLCAGSSSAKFAKGFSAEKATGNDSHS